MINKALLQKRFNKAASTYDEYANVQKKMGDVLIQKLCQTYTSHARLSILELGCGTGYVTEQLLNSFPYASVTAVDFAPHMIEQAKKRRGAEKAAFICGDIEKISFSGPYDVIISNATFQWLNDLQGTVARLCEALHDNGALMFTTFGNETFQELHLSFQQAVGSLEGKDERAVGQSFFTAQQLKELCEPQGHVSMQQARYIEWFSTVRDFLDSVRKIGAANSNDGISSQSPSVFRNMIRLYEEQFQQNGCIPATYHALFCSIMKQGEKKDGTRTNENGLEAARA
ncbi:malonyl-ACP O-methyltransferase BioC [Ectobacillus panaciterrae]|uniref:malonyl-ACP O-methyltransferase BioC n=1 Tax=Ectobacillus panaciterrae TaxID=363872 RepID=UPI0003FE0633|nr:malonyl-ACP O-methyltransferase BioC [Ectobacillus panaciterrae]